MKKYYTLGIITFVLATTHSYAQTCNANITPSAPDSRYQLLNNDTEVKDVQTGLIWQRCSLGQTFNGTSCIGTATSYNWTNALQTAVNMGNGWRIPNIKELASLIEKACYDPSINGTYFPNTLSTYYWSSSPLAYDSSRAWVIYFGYGYVHDNHNNYNDYVRLVRSSQ